METINLYTWEIDFIKELLRSYPKDKHSDLDTRLMAAGINKRITDQVPDNITHWVVITAARGDEFLSHTFATYDEALWYAEKEWRHLTRGERKQQTISIQGWYTFDPNDPDVSEWQDNDFYEEYKPEED